MSYLSSLRSMKKTSLSVCNCLQVTKNTIFLFIKLLVLKWTFILSLNIFKGAPPIFWWSVPLELTMLTGRIPNFNFKKFKALNLFNIFSKIAREFSRTTLNFWTFFCSLLTGDKVKIQCCHDDYSIWFDVTPQNR